jgi:CheY-like chemotaxis protein
MSWLNRATKSADRSAVAIPEASPDAPVVMLVEDEPAVRGLFAMSLRRDGYHVIEASNGAEALVVFEQAPRVDLVVTDVVMPIMKGTELARRLRERKPDQRFLFVTGYVLHEELGPNAELLQKPFVRQELVRRVTGIVGQAMPPDE